MAVPFVIPPRIQIFEQLTPLFKNKTRSCKVSAKSNAKDLLKMMNQMDEINAYFFVKFIVVLWLLFEHVTERETFLT